LLDIPHFGMGWDVRNCVKQLMEVTHKGYLWLEQPVSIDVDLITYITWLPPRGETPTQFPDDKTKEKALTKEMKNTYGIERGSRGIIIKHISDATTRVATKLMPCKLLRNFRKEEVPVGVITVSTQCEEGTLLRWAPYLLNLFLEDCKDV
jgi:hypothetical protein